MKKIITLITSLALMISLAACSGAQDGSLSIVNESQNSATTSDIVASTAAQASTTTVDSTVEASSVAEALAEDSNLHDDAEDYLWDNSSVISIQLNGDSITIDGNGVTVEGSIATITSAGTYSLSGTLADGQIIVNTEDKGVVRLIFNGVDIQNASGAPVYIQNAEETVIVLADHTENFISDAAEYVFAAPEQDEPNAAIFSASDLTIYGNGSLTVNGNFNDGIASKDGLIITSATIVVQAVDDGIRGKDYLVVRDGNITVNAQGDGLKSDNQEDATKGYILIEYSLLNITSGYDAMDAQTDVMITDGEIMISSGGGSNTRVDETTSAKGIKAGSGIYIDHGTFTIDSADDAINTNGNLTINGGNFTLSTGDDGVHADSTLTINDGIFRITDSYEGIESAVITINTGEIYITSSDDGLNVAGGVDGSGMNPGMGPGVRPGRGGGPGQDAFTYSGDYYLYIHGGYLVIEAAGDGADVNGAIEMTGGVLIVNGPIERMNSALDYDAYFNITGGFLVAVGSFGMAQAPDESSSQNSILINLNSTLLAGTLIHIQNSDGDEILTFSPTKQYQSIAFSSPELVKGKKYTIYYDGSTTGTLHDSLYQGGVYTPGNQLISFTISSVVTLLGNSFR